MKIFLKLFTAFWLLPILAQAKPYYLPFDQIRFPELGSRWEPQILSGDALIRFDLNEDALKPGQFRSQVVLRKRALKTYEQKNSLWRASEKKALPPNAQIVLNPFDAQKESGEWRYVTTVNLMPVLGNRIARRQGATLYSLECQSEEQVQADLYDWCAKLFSKIQWGDALPIASDGKKQTLNNFVKTVDYRPQALADSRQDLARHFSPSYTDYKQYAYLVILQSLIDGESGTSVHEAETQDLLAVLAQDPKPTEPLTDWLADNRDYARGTFTQKTAERILQRPQRPPYWLIGAWLRPTAPELALNLMERDTADFPLKNAMMGRLYAKLGHTQKAAACFAKADPAGNPDVAVQLAQVYFEQHDNKNAQKWLASALEANPDDVGAQLLQAKLLEAADKTDAAAQIYADLANRPSLPPDIAVPIYTKYAESSLDSDTKIQYYNKILALQARSPEALYALGRLYLLEKNDAPTSLAYFEKFVQVAPSSDPKVGELRVMIEQIRTMNASAENAVEQ